MPVKIRLARRGRRKQPYYHIIVADARAPRDGKFIEQIGSYNPMTKPASIELDRDKAYEWLMKGAQPTETARAILRFKGVLYKKHLQRGVAKGAMSQEDADRLFQEFVNAKEEKVAARFEQTRLEKLEFLKKVGDAPVATEEASAEAPAAEAATEAPAAEAEAPAAEPTPEAEAPAAEEAPAEAPVAAAEEAPAAPEATEEAPAPVAEAPEAAAEEE